MASKELRDLARKLADAIACHDLPEVQRLLDLIDGKPPSKIDQPKAKAKA